MSSPNGSSCPLGAVVALSLLFAACHQPDTHAQSSPPTPSALCAEVWEQEPAADFADLLEEVTETRYAVWPEYQLGDGAVVLHAGTASDASECLGLWYEGRLLDYVAVSDAPKLATPLYGYYLNFGSAEGEFVEGLSKASEQPASIGQWLTDHGIDSAVLMPVEFPQFPFEIPTLMKVQVAIHEAFHVDVMIRRWFTGVGHWPAWDQQPDRPSLQKCYAADEAAKEVTRNEQLLLADVVAALVAEDKPQACTQGRAFLDHRVQRYAQLADVTVPRHDGSAGSCQEAENIMELEEGLADYASWTMMYEIGAASWADLHRRYQAIQNDPFYLTGAMLMHAATLMHEGETTEIINAITTSSSVEDGALATLFEAELKAYCGQ